MTILLDAPMTTTLAERTLDALAMIAQEERAHEATREALAAMTLERDAWRDLAGVATRKFYQGQMEAARLKQLRKRLAAAIDRKSESC